MHIAVDAMGGDNFPYPSVHGAVEAVKESGIHVTLVGNEKIIKKALGLHFGLECLSICHCDEMITMDEAPITALRRKKNASIRVAFELLKRGEADAVVSAGNSGATMAAGIMVLGRMAGLARPSIATVMPGANGSFILTDSGANVDCSPEQLLEFGLMAHCLAKAQFGLTNPRVALLNIGEEQGKGNEQTRVAWELFRKSRLNFTGNIEGNKIFSGEVDIIVCDGFVGNIVLKLSEGLVSSLMGQLTDGYNDSFSDGISFLASRNILGQVKKKMDHEEYGGAPLLGINGISIVCHGSSSAKAITKSILMAAFFVESQLINEINKIRTELQ